MRFLQKLTLILLVLFLSSIGQTTPIIEGNLVKIENKLAISQSNSSPIDLPLFIESNQPFVRDILENHLEPGDYIKVDGVVLFDEQTIRVRHIRQVGLHRLYGYWETTQAPPEIHPTELFNFIDHSRIDIKSASFDQQIFLGYNFTASTYHLFPLEAEGTFNIILFGVDGVQIGTLKYDEQKQCIDIQFAAPNHQYRLKRVTDEFYRYL